MSQRAVRGLATAIFIAFVIATIHRSPSAANTDSGAGKDLFARMCSGCHAVDTNKGGPRLRGVLGRKAGTAAAYPYSDALRKSGIIWTEPLLLKWLEDPDALVKDADMEFSVPKASEREALVAYLKSLTD
jgi:cytochrome c